LLYRGSRVRRGGIAPGREQSRGSRAAARPLKEEPMAVDPERFALRASPWPATRLSRKMIVGGLILCSVLGLWLLQVRPWTPRTQGQVDQDPVVSGARLPDIVTRLPADYRTTPPPPVAGTEAKPPAIDPALLAQQLAEAQQRTAALER